MAGSKIEYIFYMYEKCLEETFFFIHLMAKLLQETTIDFTTREELLEKYSSGGEIQKDAVARLIRFLVKNHDSFSGDIIEKTSDIINSNKILKKTQKIKLNR